MEQTQREWAEQAAANERARERNIQRYVEMFLTLGPDVIPTAIAVIAMSSRRLSTSSATGGRSCWTWSGRSPREEATLAALEKGRQPDPADEFTAREILDTKDAAHRQRVTDERKAISRLKAQATAERKELESFIQKRRGSR